MTRTNFCIAMLATLTACLAAWTIGQSARAQEQGRPQRPDDRRRLKNDVGTWDATLKIWPQPNAKPLESKAVEKNELLPGGQWLVSRFEGDFGVMKFVGVGTWGYDPAEKKYVGTWIDNMTPHLTVIKADYDPATKTMTGVGQSRDAATGKPNTTKQISRYPDDNSRVFEMFTNDPDGKEFKMMEITYKRRTQ